MRQFLPKVRVLIAIASLAYGFSIPQGHAQQAGGFVIEIPEVRNYAALAVGSLPDYMGSDEYTVGIAPAGLIKFGNSERYARLIATELSANLLDSKEWALGPVLNYRFERSDVEDQLVDRMRDVDGTLEAGLFAGWSWISEIDLRHRFATSVQFLNDIGDEHDGFLANISVRYFQPVSRPLTLSVGANLTYGSSDYTKTYFSVDADNAARSGLRQFDADSGLRDIRVPIMAVWSFSPKWHLAGGLIYSRLLGDAADSPVTNDRGSENQFFFGVGLAYAW
jgi:outer membrane protein